jgi:hypothetical protein
MTLHLVPRLEMSGNKPPLSYMPLKNTQGQLYLISVGLGCGHDETTLEAEKWVIL